MTKYMSQTGAGAHDGNSLGNAYSADESNAHSFTDGDILILNGALVTRLIANAGITFLFATGAYFSVPAIPSAGMISANAINGVTVDFGPNGYMESTDNGSNLGHQVDSCCVLAIDCNNFRVINPRCHNVFVRVKGADQHAYGTAVSCIGTWVGWVVENIEADNCYIALDGRYDGACSFATWTVKSIRNCNWGGRLGDGGPSASFTGLSVSYGSVRDFENWDDTSANAFHHNGFYIWAESGGIFQRAEFNGVTIGPGWGEHATGGIFTSGAGMEGPILINNNLLKMAVGDTPSNALLNLSGGDDYAVTVANNTLVGEGEGRGIALGVVAGGASGLTATLENNSISGMTATTVTDRDSYTITANHNSYFDLRSGEEFSYSVNGNADFMTLAQWKVATGQDADALTSDPELLANYSPNSGSDLIAAGANLTSFFDTDILNRIRPTPATAWCIGAFEGPWTGDSLVLATTTYSGPWTALVSRAAPPEGQPSEQVVQGTNDYPTQVSDCNSAAVLDTGEQILVMTTHCGLAAAQALRDSL